MIPPYLRKPKYVIFAVLLILGLGTLFLLPKGGARGWVPDADCGRTSLTTPGERVPKGAKVYWAATGPAGRYVVAVGAEQLTIDANQRVSVARKVPGSEPITGLTDLAGCLKSGSIDGVLPGGEHTLRLFRIDGTTVTEIAQRTFTVTG
ncbi:MAG: hypothetical protein H0T78_02360 [Longispora sp.]|nr:hypothetical protein [Longispora sp. (in: high G+C Gram-positive bacteria)]